MSVLKEKLRHKSLKITPQRLEVLRALQKLYDQHPSAELIYQTVKRRSPAVSLATVYKTLETLVETGEIRVAMVSQGKTRYDTRMDYHHHFLCRCCGQVEDVDVRMNCLETCGLEAMRENYQVERSEVVFHGLCSPCHDSMKGPVS